MQPTTTGFHLFNQFLNSEMQVELTAMLKDYERFKKSYDGACQSADHRTSQDWCSLAARSLSLFWQASGGRLRARSTECT